jgi:hypothetical protein
MANSFFVLLNTNGKKRNPHRQKKKKLYIYKKKEEIHTVEIINKRFLFCIDVDDRLNSIHNWMDLLDFLLHIIVKDLCHIEIHQHLLDIY